MNRPIVDIQCFHSASKGKRTVVCFNRKGRGKREYTPADWSVRRLALWLERDMFHHTFAIGTHMVKVFIVPKKRLVL